MSKTRPRTFLTHGVHRIVGEMWIIYPHICKKN